MISFAISEQLSENVNVYDGIQCVNYYSENRPKKSYIETEAKTKINRVIFFASSIDA